MVQVRSVLGALSLVVSAMAFAGTVQAQAELTTGSGIDVHLFRPAVDSKGYLSVNGTDILGHKDYSLALVLDAGLGILPYDNFVYNPSLTPDRHEDQSDFTDHIVDTAITGTLRFNYGLWNRVIFGAQVPIQIVSGPRVVVPGYYNDDDGTPAGLDQQGFGNIVVHSKVRLLRRERAPIGLAGVLQIELPTGTPESFSGEPGMALWPSIAAEWMPVPQFRVGLNAGYRFNSGEGSSIPLEGRSTLLRMTSFGDMERPYCQRDSDGDAETVTCPSDPMGGDAVQYDDLITFGAGVAWRFAKSLELVGEVYGGQLVNGFGDDGGLGMEAVGGLKVFVEQNSYLVLGGGGEILQGINSANWRAIVGFIFEPSIGDRDGDGYKDDVDQCPDQPEDFDGFEDEDGCPDPDNDKDGILDVDDECPLVPEDRDGDADEDGCPEGSLGDRDGDGILDNVDECPDDPEDRDGFQDEDGCPDPDNDNDGILDVDDLCPDDPEDKDGFEDEDGCPDRDNDKDRILDVDDACPDDPETYNGHEDEDGCPDKGSVVIEENQIVILDKIYFATDSAEILPRSYPIIDAVAATLKGNPQITLVEVQGHADERGSDEYNLKLTRDRAASVVQALIQRGVGPRRLRSAGYGERCPVDPGHTASAWEKNRRVEFKIIRTDMGPTGVDVACPAGQELVPSK